MPELNSRPDGANWLTPAVADILVQGAGSSGSSGSTREIMLTLQRELEEHSSPIRIINTRPMPSYTMYIARPMTVGKAGNRHTVTLNDIEHSLTGVAESHGEWELGFLPEIEDDTDACGIIVRTENHQRLNLRRLVVQRTFRKFVSNGAFPCGVTFDQKLIVRDLFETGHVILIGDNDSRRNILQGMLLSQVLFNTPGEVRIALLGENAREHENFMQIPHSLGRILAQPQQAQRLLSGFVKEMQRRIKILERRGVASLEEYNAELREKRRTELPRIVIVLDSVSDQLWNSGSNDWLPGLTRLIQGGQQVGIHAIIVSDDLDPPRYLRSLYRSIDTKIVMRSVAGRLARHLSHESLLPFTDAFVVNDATRDVIAVETYDVAPIELENVIDYWLKNVRQRLKEATGESVSGRTGVTGLLETQELQKPPVPEKPPQQVLKRVMKALGGRNEEFRQIATRMIEDTHRANASLAGRTTDEQEALVAAHADAAETQDFPAQMPENEQEEITATDSPVQPMSDVVQVQPAEDVFDATATLSDVRQTGTIPVASPEGSANEIVTNENSLTIHAEDISTTLLNQAQVLGAYLGWLSTGTLIDIFGINQEIAEALLQILRDKGYLEETSHPVSRFIRLSAEIEPDQES